MNLHKENRFPNFEQAHYLILCLSLPEIRENSELDPTVFVKEIEFDEYFRLLATQTINNWHNDKSYQKDFKALFTNLCVKGMTYESFLELLEKKFHLNSDSNDQLSAIILALDKNLMVFIFY